MRKLTSILLLASLCLSLLGYHLVFHFQISAAKKEMKAFLQNEKKHEDVVELHFTREEAKELEWEEKSEFRYHGEMYDVIEQKNFGEEILIRCIADNKETALLNSFQKNQRHHSSNSVIAQLITTQFVLPADHHLIKPERTIEKTFDNYSAVLAEPSSTVFSPPPDVC